MKWIFISILMLFGALQGFIIALILFFKKKENKKTSFYLSLILFSFSMNLLYYFCLVVGFTAMFPAMKLFYLPWFMLVVI